MDLSEQTERMQSFYNLKHDPFGTVVDAMVFSGAGGRYEISETIRHLLSYSHQDSLLVGPNGSGKRTLALQVLKLLEDQWRIAWIDGSIVQTPNDLLKEIIGQLGLGLKVDQPSDVLIQRVIDIVTARYQNEESFLIVVQFAEQLPVEIIDVLKLIRSNTSDVDQRIRQLWLSEDWSVLAPQISEEEWYVHPLDSLSDADAEQYLKDRLVAAGNVGEMPFAEKDVARLNQLAKGLPIALNEAAGDYLISSTFRTTERKYSFPITHVVAGIAALALVVIAVLYQTNESKAESDHMVERQPPDSLTAVEKKLAEAVAKVEAKQIQAQPPATDSAALTNPLKPTVEAVDVPKAESEAVKIEQASLEKAPVKITPPIIELEPAPVLAKPEIQVPAKVDNLSMLGQALDAEFTLQLVGVREREKLEKLLAEFADQKRVAIVRTVHEGKPWYVLIYGQFTTKADAAKAVPEIPVSIGVKEPWIRSYKSIRDSM